MAANQDLRAQSTSFVERGQIRGHLSWGLAIFGLALVLRVLFQLEISDHPLSRQLFLDPALYDGWAQTIASGEWLGRDVFYANPLYPYFLALIYRCLGHTLLGAKLIQSVLGALNCLMIALIGQRVFNRRTGILAGLMAAFYAPLIFYEGTITIATLATFLSVLVVFLLLKEGGPSPWRSFGAGAVWGLRALARIDLTFLAAIAWCLVQRDGRTFRRRLILVLLFCGGTAVVILPVTARNMLVGERLVFISAHGGETFYGGNNPRARGTYAPPSGVRPGTVYEHEDFRRLASDMVGHQLSLAESSSFWFRRAVEWIRTHPGGYLRLQLRKLSLFWSPWEIPDNRNFHFFKRFSNILRLPLLSFTILGPLALLGMVLGLKTWRRSLLLYLQVLLSMISVLLFFVLARYRLPTVPFLILFAAYALQWTFARCQERRWRPLAFFLLPTLAILVLYAVLVPGQAERGLEARYETMGVALIREGRVDEGIAELRGVIQVAPKRITAHYNLGVVYLQERAQYALAAEEFEAVIHLQEDYVQAHYMLGRAYQGLGRIQEAVREFRRELEFWPKDLSTRLALGMAYVKLERWPEAEEQFRQVTDQQGDNVGGHRLLGNVLYLQGKYQGAMVSWERALELDPSDEELRNTLESLRKRLKGQKAAALGGP